MISILHISTFDSGGAGKAAYRIHKGLLEFGVQSHFVSLYKKTNNTDVTPYCYNNKRRFIYRVVNKLREIIVCNKEKFYFYGAWKYVVDDISKIDTKLVASPNVIILHWVSGFINLDVILQLKKKYNAKVYWYLMDMAPMTGGCHFAWDCDGYTKDCSNCPATRYIFNSFPKNELQHKKKALKELDIQIISGTSWLTWQAKQSTLFKYSTIYDVMLGIDESVFKPLNTGEVNVFKEKYKLDKSKKIIAFGTSKVTEERKGFQYLLDALKILSSKLEFDTSNILLVTAGVLSDKSLFPGIEHIHIGYLGSDVELASLYQISDVFISPSIEDSGPMMINESIMCGTPVVSFDMGVAADLIIKGETGYVARHKDSNDLAFGIQKILELSESDHHKVRDNCRKIGLEKTSVSVQMEKIIHILNKSEEI
jgi:glycosyltransferase involved in cell wall biosynthesis